MTYGLVSLSIIMMIAVACPIITQLIPGKPMPQTVLMLAFGAIFGPFILDKIWVTKAVELLSEPGLAFLFQLDVVLGAFAAGFILRFVTPNGNHTLNPKLEGVGHGFLIPVFFVVSGASIDVKAVVANPALLITFIIMLLVHAVPIFVATTLDHRVNPLDPQDKLTVSLYFTTALPLIVAVTSLAVQGGTMHQTIASTLVAAGAAQLLGERGEVLVGAELRVYSVEVLDRIATVIVRVGHVEQRHEVQVGELLLLEVRDLIGKLLEIPRQTGRCIWSCRTCCRACTNPGLVRGTCRDASGRRDGQHRPRPCCR